MEMETIRDRRQREFADVWLEHRKGILYLCPRFGKIYTTINILEKLKPNNVLISYPDKKIEESWKKDLETRGYNDSDITYTTHLSLHKHQNNTYDLVIIDEIHLLSEAQIEAAYELLKNNKNVLGLTGTLSTWTESDLKFQLDLPVIATYSIEQAIEEGVIVDYQITVIKVPLDREVRIQVKDKMKTEKQMFDNISWVIDNVAKPEQSMMLRLKRMRIIQNSLAKKQMTKAVLKRYADERILVFCGTTDIADSLGIPSYHSKSKEGKEVFEDFAQGKGNHLAVDRKSTRLNSSHT